MKLGITILIHNKDDIEFVPEFPCLLGHPVSEIFRLVEKTTSGQFQTPYCLLFDLSFHRCQFAI